MEWKIFLKQCYVVLGVSLNLAQFGLVIGFSALLLPQLKKPDSAIPIDDVTGSWIASMPALSLMIGNIVVAPIMGKFGRKIANTISIAIVTIGWLCVVLATNVTILLIARFLQGISLGMALSLSPVLIAEYTSPRWRGAFLTSLSLIMSLATLFVHTITAYITWKSAALVCTAITAFNLVMVLPSPESPSWLASQGRYDRCRRVFQWLRGSGEEDELNKLIEADRAAKKQNLNNKTAANKQNTSFTSVVTKKEFYKPIFVAVHMYIVGLICGVNILSAYTVDILDGVTKPDVNIPLVIISLDVQRFITNCIAVLIIKKLKRRTVFFASGFCNIIATFLMALYIFMRSKSLMPFDHSMVGVLLVHFHIFSAIIGAFPVPLIVCGELFSLKYRSISSGITSLFLSIGLFVVMKTFPILNNSIGLGGSYLLYGAILCYSILIAWFYLPETKDKTLQEIEEELLGRKLVEDPQSAQSLMNQQRNDEEICK